MKNKRIISLLLALIILISGFPLSGLANDIELDPVYNPEETIEEETIDLENTTIEETKEENEEVIINISEEDDITSFENDSTKNQENTKENSNELEIKEGDSDKELEEESPELIAAREAVEKAENEKSSEKIKAILLAKKLVSSLEEGEAKTDLTNRIDAIDITVNEITLTWSLKNETKKKVILDTHSEIHEHKTFFLIDDIKTDDPFSIEVELVAANDDAHVYKIPELDEDTQEFNFYYEIESKNTEVSQEYLVSIEYSKPEISKEDRINEIIGTLTNKYNGTSEDWSAMAMSALGRQEDVNQEKLISIAKTVIAENRTSTDLERVTISLTSLGYDVTDMLDANGRRVNVIEMIANHGGSQYGSDLGTLNGYIFALIAYDSGNYKVPAGSKWTRDKIISYIIDNQLSDGGWNLLNEGSGDTDITAMTLQALAPYKSRSDVGIAINKALSFLSRIQSTSGAYGGFGVGTNSNSTAMVVVALNNLGIDADKDSRFIKNGNSVLDGLLSFATGTNEFGYMGNDSPDGMATEQSFRALIGYSLKKNVYLFKEPWKKTDSIVTADSLSIVNEPKTDYYLGDFLDFTGLEAKVVFSDGTIRYLSYEDLSISDIDTETTGSKKVYVSYMGVSDSFWITVNKRPTNEDPNKPNKPNHTEKLAYISVVVPPGPNVMTSGKVMQAKTAFPIVEGKDTAFSMLQKTGLNYNYNYHEIYAGVYVSSIEGLAEFDGGPYSGWMYRVNGVFPDHSSSLYHVKAGDYVEWLYTRDLGKDVGGYIEGIENEIGEKTISVNTKTTEGGTISPQGKVKITSKKPINFIIRPSEGYVIYDVEVDGKSIGPVENFTASVDNISDNGLIYAIFKKEAELTEAEKKELKEKASILNKFVDIQGHWAAKSINYVYEKGYFKGISQSNFGPDEEMTRGMLVTVLGRMEKIDNYEVESSFSDVKSSDYYASYVNWAKDNSIIKGVGNRKFEPNRPINREEMAEIFNNYIKFKKIETERIKDKKIKDLDEVSDWAKESVIAMYEMGILNGKGDGNFHPKDLSTRAEVATIIERLDKLGK